MSAFRPETGIRGGMGGIPALSAVLLLAEFLAGFCILTLCCVCRSTATRRRLLRRSPTRASTARTSSSPCVFPVAFFVVQVSILITHRALQSKLWNSQHKPELVEAALDDTLKELGLEYLDLYLIQCVPSFPFDAHPRGFFQPPD